MIKIEAKESKNKSENLEYVEPEIWKPINNTNALYEVSNKARVRSWNNRGNNRPAKRKKAKILKQSLDNSGYPYIGIRIKGGVKRIRVHRLVAIAFVENPENKKCINHKDGIKTHNYPINLEWCTRSENMIHAHETNLCNQDGEMNPNAILTEADVLDIRAAWEYGWFTVRDFAEAYHVSVDCIRELIIRKTWKHI